VSERPWFYPACAAIFSAWSIILANGAYESGYQNAKAEEEESRAFVNKKMGDIGFCAWLDKSGFAEHCAALPAKGERSL
jgi:hypothetical protein